MEVSLMTALRDICIMQMQTSALPVYKFMHLWPISCGSTPLTQVTFGDTHWCFPVTVPHNGRPLLLHNF